jgi:hypothetical protein
MHYKEAMHEPDKESWVKGVEEEFNNLVKLNSFEETILPPNRKAIDTRWVMHRKTDGRYRPRLVVKGFQQVPGVDRVEQELAKEGFQVHLKEPGLFFMKTNQGIIII